MGRRSFKSVWGRIGGLGESAALVERVRWAIIFCRLDHSRAFLVARKNARVLVATGRTRRDRLIGLANFADGAVSFRPFFEC